MKDLSTGDLRRQRVMESNHPAKSLHQTFQAFAASGARALIFVFGLQGSILVAEQNPETSIHAVLDGLHESAAD